jgi:hypothetical protein
VRARVAVGGAAAAVLAAAYVYGPLAERGPVLCPMHALLGLPCPSCGLTRAFCRLARLDVWAALSFHALSVPLFAVALALPVVCAYELLRGRTSWWHSTLHSARVAQAVAVVVALHHVARVLVCTVNGTLVTDYVKTSWTYAMLRTLGIVTG